MGVTVMLKKVLIVDSRKNDRLVLSAILREEYYIFEAENMTAALDILEACSYGVSALVIDIDSSDTCGRELLKKLKSGIHENAERIPVLLTTGGSTLNNDAVLLSLGADDFIVKPCNSAVVRRRLRNTISLHELSRPAEKNASNGAKTVLTGDSSLASQIDHIVDNVESGITAAIVKGGKVSFLFANDRYFEMLGYTREQYADEVESDYDIVRRDERELLRYEAEMVSTTGSPRTVEYHVARRDGMEICLRAVISAALFDGYDEPVQLSIVHDVTAEKDIMAKVREADEQLFFLKNISRDLLSKSDTREAISNLITKLLDYSCGRRVYIFEFDYESRTASNTYEACAAGTESVQDELQQVPFEVMSFWIKTFDEKSILYIDDVNKIDDSRTMERIILKEQNITSLVAVPLRNAGKLIGFMGIDDPARVNLPIDQLMAVADYAVVMLMRRELDEKLSSENRAIKDMMENTPGGFARIKLSPNGSITRNYVNSGFCRLLGIDASDVIGENTDALDLVHPDDVEYVLSSYKHIASAGGSIRTKYRLRHKSGEYIWLMVFGRIVRSRVDGTYINIIYSELSDDEKRDMTFRESLPFILEAIMKFSADLTFAKDRDYRYICCSMAFARFAGRSAPEDIVGRTDYELFDKQTADKFRNDDIRLFSDGKSIIDMIEPIPSDDGVTHYSSTSKYVITDTCGGIIGLYGIGRDITEYRTAFEQLQLVTDNMPGGIARFKVSETSFRMMYYNEGFYRFSGFQREEYAEFVDKDPLFLVMNCDRAAVTKSLRTLVRNPDATAECIYRCVTKQGEVRWFSLKATVSENHTAYVVINAVQLDITESRQAEEAARLHDEEMKIAMSQMSRMICEYDHAAHSLTLPQTYAQWYGVDTYIGDFPQSIIGKNIIDKSCESEYLRSYDEIQSGKPSGSFSTQLVRVDGSRHWEHYEFVTLFNDEGKAIKTIIAADDITGQIETKRKYEAELMFRRELMKDSEFYYEINLTKNIIEDFRSAHGKGMGPAPGAVITEKMDNRILKNVAPQDREIVKSTAFPEAVIKAYNEGRTSITLDYRHIMPDKSLCWMRLSGTVLKRPETGDLIYVQSIKNIDIEKKDSMIIENIMDEEAESIMIISVKTGSAHFAKLISKEGRRIPRYVFPFDERVLRVISDNVIGADAERCKQFFNVKNLIDALSRDEKVSITYVRYDEGQAKRKIATVSYADDTHCDIVILIRDITDIYEEEQRQKQRLQEAVDAANKASRAKSEFLSRMSHDIRTPLNAIMAFSCEEMTDDADKLQLLDNLGKIHSSGDYLLGIINDVLDMSRIEQKKMVLHPSPYSVDEFIANVRNIIGELSKDKRIEFVLNADNAGIYGISVDKVRFNQIFMNLLSNAVKFTPDGGRVELIIESGRG